jgi:uncharacterized RDD family membrane protein YckC
LSVPTSGSLPPPPPIWDARPPETTVRYAGFWLRLVAWVVDTIVLVIIWQVISLFFPAAPAAPPTGASPDVLWKYWLACMPPDKVAASTIISWAYFALQESSSIQATLGKRLLAIRVSREDGSRLGLGAASIRAWPLYLNSAGWVFAGWMAGLVAVLAFISCLAVAFSSRKQGFHDKMAGAVLTQR